MGPRGGTGGGRQCGAKEIRTPDLFDANEALYQLSYSPVTTPLPKGNGVTKRS